MPPSGRSSRRVDARRPGRPPKYGRPSQVVAVTLPREIIKALRARDLDLGWAIVSLVETAGHARDVREPPGDAQLVEVGAGQSLIVVDTEVLRGVPGIQVVPLSERQAFLALAPGHGLADLEIAVLDRIERLKRNSPARRALGRVRDQLRRWRRDPELQFETRSIILVGKAR